ncbi:hypothetical protein V8E36_005886 [Tilletia maclaganii]
MVHSAYLVLLILHTLLVLSTNVALGSASASAACSTMTSARTSILTLASAWSLTSTLAATRPAFPPILLAGPSTSLRARPSARLSSPSPALCTSRTCPPPPATPQPNDCSAPVLAAKALCISLKSCLGDHAKSAVIGLLSGLGFAIIPWV